MPFTRKIVLSLGGSLIVPDDVDAPFLRTLRALIQKEAANGTQFFIIAGGGRICRKYQEAAKSLDIDSQDALDWVGIYSTRFNAEFIRILFGSMAHGRIITDPKEMGETKEAVVIGAGTVPGHSSDFAAVEMAKRMGATTLINLSNIDYVYEQDPRQFPDAKKIERASWKEFRAILPKDYHPGINAPFDPVAAKEAESIGLEVVIMNGKPVEHLENYLAGKAFKGTVIK